MNEDFIGDIIKDCNKTFAGLKKKQNKELTALLDNILANLNSLKTNTSMDNESKEKFISSISSVLIDSINQVITLKFNKYYISMLNITKKFTDYKLFAKDKSENLIKTLKDIYNISKINDENQNKVLEIIQNMTVSSYYEVKFDNISNIYMILLKAFNNAAKNKDFKNPIRTILTTLTEKVYESGNQELILQITTFLFSWYSLSIKDKPPEKKENENEINTNTNEQKEQKEDIDANLKNEVLAVLNQKKTNIYIQSLGLELLTQGFIVLDKKKNDEKEKNNNFDYNFLNKFISEQLIKYISVSIGLVKKTNPTNEEDTKLTYLYFLKICRLGKILLHNYDICYEILNDIADLMSDQQIKEVWKYNLCFELLLTTLNDTNILHKIYDWNKDIINKLYSLLISFMDFIEVYFKEDREANNMIKNLSIKVKELDTTKIFIEGDELIVYKKNSKKYYLILVNECVQHIITSFEQNKFTKNEIFEMMSIHIREIILKLLTNEFKKIEANINLDNESDLILYITYIKKMMILYNTLKLEDKIEEYFKGVSTLCTNFSPDINIYNKNIYLALHMLNMIKHVTLISKNSWYMILQAIEVFNHKFNYEKIKEYSKYDLDRVIDDIHNLAKNLELKKDNQPDNTPIKFEVQSESTQNKATETRTPLGAEEAYKNELRKNICLSINSMFVSAKNIDATMLKNIIEALSSCIETSITKNDKVTFKVEILFYILKMLTLGLLNLDNIYIIFDPYITVINKLIDNNMLANFSINLLCTFIPEILLRYEEIEKNINKNMTDDNKIWLDEKWQKLLFSPLLTLLSQPDIYKLIKNKIFTDIGKIIQRSGNYLDIYGWETLIQSLIILSSNDIDNTFVLLKQTLNDYKSYITLFNIEPLMKLLKTFVADKKDQNTSFSAVELYCSCVNIIDDYKLGKRAMSEKQKAIYDGILKGKDLKNYCDELYFELFTYLIPINNDQRVDIRKSGINIFTEILVTKMAVMKAETALKIINEVFFTILSTNVDKIKSGNKDPELEQTMQTTILSMIKILKEFFEGNVESKKELFAKYLNKIIEAIPFASIELNNEIIKSCIEIKLIKTETVPLLITEMEIYFKILVLVNDYIKNPNFIEPNSNKVSIYKLYSTVLNYLIGVFCYNGNKEIFVDENFKNIFMMLDTLLDSVYQLEIKLFEAKPRKIIDLENEIFNFIEGIPVEKNIIYNYLLDKIGFDIKKPHSEAISRRIVECFQNLVFTQKAKNENKLWAKKDEKEIIQKYIKKLIELMNLRGQNETVDVLINTVNDPNNILEDIVFNKYLGYSIKFFDEIVFDNLIKFKENDKIKEEEKKDLQNNIFEIYMSILEYFDNFFNQSIISFKSISKQNLQIIANVYIQMDIDSINFIINKLISNMLFLIGDNNIELFGKLKEKLLTVLIKSCDISYIVEGIAITTMESLKLVCVNELLKYCKYEPNEEIIKEIKINVNREQYINNKINLIKKLSIFMVKQIIELLKKFRKDEIVLGDMPLIRSRVQEIYDLLKSVKELELFPELNKETKVENEIVEQKEETSIFDIVSKTKKLHLFYLQPILNEFIDTKENDIKNLIKEIFKEMNDILGIPKLDEEKKA